MSRSRAAVGFAWGLGLLLLTTGCANFIRQEEVVIWDRVPDTDTLMLDDMVMDGAVARARLRYFCDRQQFEVTKVFETPYAAKHELYEVPVGALGTAVGLAVYVVAEVVSLGAVDDDVSTAVLDWGAAGLNPILPVEGGMFEERYVAREKPGSRHRLEGSARETYDDVVVVEGGRAEAWLLEPGSDPNGSGVELEVGDDALIEVNLLEVASRLRSPAAQKVVVEVTVRWHSDAAPVDKKFEFFIEDDLARRLHAAREPVSVLLDFASSAAAVAAASRELLDLGFSREVAMMIDQRP